MRTTSSRPARCRCSSHLIELRQRLIYSLVTVGVLCIVVLHIFARQLFDFLLGPYKAAVPNLADVHLIYTAPQEFFFTQLSVALFAAIFFAFPMIATQIYMFVAPGLYKRERKAFLPYLVATPFFFVLGAAAGLFWRSSCRWRSGSSSACRKPTRTASPSPCRRG